MIVGNFNFINILVFIVFFFVCLLLFFKLKYKILLYFLRLLIIFLLVGLTVNISYKKPKRIDELKILLLVDNSYSMKFNNRLNKIKNFLKENYKILKKYNPTIYSFNEDLSIVDKLEELDVENKRTKIKDVVEKVYNDRRYDIIFIFSDGINYTSELPYLQDKMFLVPICFLEKNFKDLSISDLRTSKIGFKDVEHVIIAKIISYGYDNVKCNLRLINLDTKEILSFKEFILKEGENEISLSFIPKYIGEGRYFLKLQTFKEEITYENNIKYFNLEIKKNKIRVLYLCGQPSPEYFHLRNLLKNDPSVDLVSFVILRNPESIVIVPDDDLALIPFPTYDIFVKELFNYDLIIFENFAYHRFGIYNHYLENVKKFVLGGGGFIMIGGVNSFFLGGYKFTPIEEILPVELSEKEKFLYLEYQPQIVNYNNKFVKIFDNEKNNKELWENIPKLGNYQKVIPKKEATVILKYQNDPLMCYIQKGKGRIFVSLTNTTWRWNLGGLLSKKYNYKDLYTKFWKNIIYWCAGEENLKDIYILCSDNNNLNEEVEVSVISNLDDKVYSELQGYVIYPDGNEKVISIEKINNKKYKFSFIPDVIGQYKINVFTSKGKDIIKEEKKIWVSYSSFDEITKLKPDLDYMSKLAQINKQRVYNIEEINIEQLIAEINKDLSKKFVYVFEIYKSPIFGLLIIILFMLEVYFARVKR